MVISLTKEVTVKYLYWDFRTKVSPLLGSRVKIEVNVLDTYIRLIKRVDDGEHSKINCLFEFNLLYLDI